ncbi:MAG: hypothetical protein A2X36_01735 [Elusimicrobia bacterium GWA2_69_24]|nr:MAG: hypothetical protein A2X36_01735 [Elusimicrobia bacterium GWA2_69_24]HBL19119.1 Holliday junction branch migration protein RuvA [Elusimicrobiota bacterium]
MIASLRGTLLEKDLERVVLEAAGVGYEVLVCPATAARLPAPGREALLYVTETVGMYGGATTLYGFATPEERRMFLAFKEIKAVGAKKALDYLDKASRSPAEFQRAIQHQDTRILTGMFGFSKKTAEKLIAGLSGKLGTPPPPPSGGDLASELDRAGPLAQAAEALAALGYRPAEYRAAIESIQRDLQGRELPGIEEVLRMALRRL